MARQDTGLACLADAERGDEPELPGQGHAPPPRTEDQGSQSRGPPSCTTRPPDGCGARTLRSKRHTPCRRDCAPRPHSCRRGAETGAKAPARSGTRAGGRDSSGKQQERASAAGVLHQSTTVGMRITPALVLCCSSVPASGHRGQRHRAVPTWCATGAGMERCALPRLSRAPPPRNGSARHVEPWAGGDNTERDGSRPLRRNVACQPRGRVGTPAPNARGNVTQCVTPACPHACTRAAVEVRARSHGRPPLPRNKPPGQQGYHQC